MLSITRNSGFQMTFSNGWTVSVQWGPGNYCENRDHSTMEDLAAHFRGDSKAFTQCVNAEVAAWDKDGNWHKFEHDEVMGWLTADQVAAFIAGIACGQGCIARPEEVEPEQLETQPKQLEE